jgi:hypothetical protein
MRRAINASYREGMGILRYNASMRGISPMGDAGEVSETLQFLVNAFTAPFRGFDDMNALTVTISDSRAIRIGTRRIDAIAPGEGRSGGKIG